MCLIAAATLWSQKKAAPSASGSVQADPNAACAGCHRDIYERYRGTPMANASGPAQEGFIPGDFEHQASAVHYRIVKEGDRVWLHYERDDPARPLNGQQELRYFIGSGKRGRTYLFEQQGYWFESPINWYGKKHLWDMAPNFLAVKEMPLTMPVDPGCLHCHASGASTSLPDARNHYSVQPFAHGGITCSSCHGDVAAHLATKGTTPMLKIDALEPVRRDSICLNCHLEGQAAVDRLGKRPEEFKPGDNLFDYTLFFVYGNENGSGGRATSQYEALLKSACKRNSGDKLTCTTCHDPHGSPAPPERVSFYRQRCLQCHGGSAFAHGHHPENPDCTACHMARPPSNDIAHEQVTDHWIRKRVSEQPLPEARQGDLVSVGGFPADDRDLGLAYAQMASRGNPSASARAMELLRRVEKETTNASQDHELHAQLGFLEQLQGNDRDAAAEYREALRADGYDALAAGDLALLELRQRNVSEAIGLWRSVFEHDPARVEAGLNLAVVECAEGNAGEAQKVLERVLLFSPDDAEARNLGEQIQSGTHKCGRQ